MEAEFGEQVLQRIDITRIALHADDEGLLPGWGCEQRCQQCAALAAAARRQVEAREPEFVAVIIDRTE